MVASEPSAAPPSPSRARAERATATWCHICCGGRWWPPSAGASGRSTCWLPCGPRPPSRCSPCARSPGRARRERGGWGSARSCGHWGHAPSLVAAPRPQAAALHFLVAGLPHRSHDARTGLSSEGFHMSTGQERPVTQQVGHAAPAQCCERSGPSHDQALTKRARARGCGAESPTSQPGQPVLFPPIPCSLSPLYGLHSWTSTFHTAHSLTLPTT